MALGRAVCAWNTLHESLAHLFSAVICGELSEPALAAWHSHKSDRAQRDMLKAAAKAALAAHPETFTEIDWLLNRTNDASGPRNDVVHSLYALLTSDGKMSVIAHDYYGNNRAKALAGKDLLKELECHRSTVVALTCFSDSLYQCVIDPGSAALPRKPRISKEA